MQNILKLELGPNSYNIHWSSSFDRLAAWIKESSGKGKNAVITNELVHGLYKDQIKTLFDGFHIITIPDGESQKNMQTMEGLCDKLLEKGFTRSDTLWAFGGGVIGDITGFLASIYMRGISYYQIPTTLLSMVDSSVGGKTGVNLSAGKNMVGAFYQPRGVFINVSFLQTLEQREINCGLSEIIKSALIQDAGLFEYLEKNSSGILEKDWSVFAELSGRSVKIKSDVVAQDEKEQGLRAILNLGHTLAHALESYYGYSGMKHGEAVSAGIHFACLLSMVEVGLPEDDFNRIIRLMDNLQLIHRYDQWPGVEKPTNERLIQLMKGDKKNIDTDIRFVLLKKIGEANLPLAIADKQIWETLEIYRKK